MNEYLLRHAVENVWCNPSQDRQFTYRLARLTPRRGVKQSINLFYERVALPTQTDTYHVYQIGQVLPRRVGVPARHRQWMRLSYLANDYLLHTDVFTNDGIQFPRFETFVWITPSRNLVVAVKINPRIHDLDNHDLYLRFYHNAYFQSVRSDGSAQLIVRGQRIETSNGLLAFQRELTELVATYGGHPLYFVNGRFVHNISLVTAGVGDSVEMVLDRSIKRVVDFAVDDLPTFTSTLDAERKYILHYDDPSVATIEYRDDVEVFLLQPGIQDRFMGVFYHHNEDSWLRMLTHKDYSIPVERLTSFVENHPTDPRHQLAPDTWAADEWTGLTGKRLRLYIRHSGYERPLMADSHRIQELYRLPSEKIVRAMTGLDSTLDLWRAEALEQCPYVQFMSADPTIVRPISYGDQTTTHADKEAAQALVGDVYGYHAAATVLAGTPAEVYVKDGRKYADLAFEHQLNSTVFEYDAAGVLLGWHYHLNGTYYMPRHDGTVRVEALTGRGDFRLNTRYGNAATDIPYGHNFRLYLKDVWAGNPTGEWRDITEADDRDEYGYLDITRKPNRWVWTIDPNTHYGAIRIDDAFLCYDLTLTRADGHLRFSVASLEDHGEGEEERVLDLPFGQLDVFLNGRALIEGLDYIVRWPEVVLSNVEYLQENLQRVTVRGYGFCQTDLSRLTTTEVGFLRYGVLSNDRHYAIHTHKVLRVVVDGHYRDAVDLAFDEERGDVVVAGERNGAPYAIQTPPVVFRDVYDDDRAARRLDDARDARVSAYMDEMFPKRDWDGPDFIETQYHVISPFANKLLHDLKEGWFYPSEIEDHYSEYEIRQWCKDYEWLLPYDPANQDIVDSHVEIYPHWHAQPVGLNLYQYNFFVRALEIYLRHRPDVSPFIYVT